MKEIGGYIELDEYRLPMLHENAILLNCGRNALAYLIKSKKIKEILIPKFLCSSVKETCLKENVNVRLYSISKDFLPVDISIADDEWLYVVNYYGQISNDKIKVLARKYKNIIIDNAQAYFQMPVDGIDTLYTCRKFFGVADGAILYTENKLDEELSIDESFERMIFLLGRFERNASDFYKEYALNNRTFSQEPIKQMSKLTRNLLHGIDYEYVKNKRTINYNFLHEKLGKYNELILNIPQGAFMYPLYIKNGVEIRKELQKKKIYIPLLWPDVFEVCKVNEFEYKMAQNILPIPCDQRYGINDMCYIVDEINKKIEAYGG